MPVVLDYDREGGVIGGHTVEELPQHHLLTTFEYGSQQPRPLYELQHYQRGLPKARNLGPPDCHRSLSTPPFHHPYRLSVFSKIHQACRRPSPAVSSKGGTFLTIFTKHFEHDASTMIAFEALFTDYNQKAIDETEFYVGIFMLISRMQAWHLLPALVEVLPASWQARDLTWLHEAAEAHYEDMVRARGASSGSSGKTRPKKFDSCLSDEREHSPVHMVEDASDADSGHTSTPQKDTPPPAKHVKRKPFNGLRTSYISAQEGLKSLYINPLALLIHQSVPEAMPNPDEVTQRPVPQPKRSRKGLVTLKLRSAKSAAVRRAKAGITKGQMTQESNEETAGLDITETSKLKTTAVHPRSSRATPSRKGRLRYGDMLAADIEHFGHFPTRRAVIARASKPYVHLCCGKGFSHPMDLKEHHRNRGRTKGGCPGKNGIAQGDDDEWDAHPSARVEYPDLNYTKVRDGYVLLDKDSRDKLDNAEAIGLKYLAEQEGFAADSEGEMEDIDAEEENEEKKAAVDDASVPAANLGLRRRSARTSYREI